MPPADRIGEQNGQDPAVESRTPDKQPRVQWLSSRSVQLTLCFDVEFLRGRPALAVASRPRLGRAGRRRENGSRDDWLTTPTDRGRAAPRPPFR